MPSDPDIAAIPDLDSFTPVPWQQNLARFACDVTVEGKPWPYCPRTILRNQLARAKELGYEFKLGIELEYFLVRQRDDGSIEIADAADTLEKPCYDMAGLTRRYDFLTTVSKYCNELGWGNYANDHEDANGQFEQNFDYDDALVSVRPRDLLPLHGPHARGAARDDRDVHAEAVHAASPATAATSTCRSGATARTCSSTRPTRAGSGSRRTAYNFVGGLKAHARAYSALTAPTVNSYKRLKLGSTTSGATWSPVWISYGYNNRTQMLRIPGPGPHRGPHDRRLREPVPRGRGRARLRPRRDREAASTRASRTRRTSTRSPTTSSRGRGLKTLPANLLEAIGELEADDVLRAALGKGRDEDYVDYYAKVKRDEWFRYHEQVTAWEIREYLTRF